MGIGHLLPPEGNWYKANLHAHTTLSDGKLSPLELKKLYQSRGYSAVAYTDHRVYRYHRELCDGEFLAIAAWEVDIDEAGEDFNHVKTYHLNLYDKHPEDRAEEKARLACPDIPYGDKEALNRYITGMKEMGFLACYNHPYWSLQTKEDYCGLRGLFAMEIYNHGCEVDGLFGGGVQAYDEMLRDGQQLFCVATDDNHNPHPPEHPFCDAFGGWIMLRAESLDYPSVMEALERGDFYASTGPELHAITLEGNKLSVSCSPVEKIYVITDGRKCHYQVAEAGAELTRAAFTLTGRERWIRVDVRDKFGFHAYSNAFFLPR